jgi:DNA-binding NtrC family response regulator
MASRPAHTTMSSQNTAPDGAVVTALAIRWVFPTSRGILTHLSEGRTVIGRDETCQVMLPGKETSRQHAEIRRDGPVTILRDLGSRNGVFLNGAQVKEAPMCSGQVLRLGEWIGVTIDVAQETSNGDGQPDQDSVGSRKAGVTVESQGLVREPEPVFSLLAPGLAGGPVLRPVLEQARRAAASTLPTVILGETGTGKDGLAHAMHEWSARRGPFIAVNCAALVPTLAESELFGYRKGAFTGADRASPGFFRAAEGGTLLLDEISDLPESIQAKLLRALEQCEIVPLGESAPVRVDVRILAATQIPLPKMVEEQRFRADLCARLDGLTIRLPPLRERKQEIAYLFAYFLNQHSGGRPPEIEPHLVEQLCLYDWPFNVRELDLLTRRLLVLHGHEPILRRSYLPEQVFSRAGSEGQEAIPTVPGRALPLRGNTPEAHRARRERELVLLTQALRAHNGSIARAAAAVGISRQRAYRLMEPGGITGAEHGEAPDPD